MFGFSVLRLFHGRQCIIISQTPDALTLANNGVCTSLTACVSCDSPCVIDITIVKLHFSVSSLRT